MRYLDPKNDLTFKKIFGEHPHLLKSFLNALLPIESPIAELEYLPSELVPEVPLLKYSIVDVRCRDEQGRQFIVEMQMLWTNFFKTRVLFNASKAYVNQLGHAREYRGVNPVFALSLVNTNFEHDTDEYYHHYSIVHSTHPDKVLEGLEFVFVELPKFKAKNLTEKKLQVLWLRFLSEIEEASRSVAPELLEVPEIEEAVVLLAESAYSLGELAAYEKYWDSVSYEKSLYSEAEEKGQASGLAKGLAIAAEAEARAKELEEQAKRTEERARNEKIEIVRKMKAKGMDNETIAELTGLPPDLISSV